MSIKTIFLGNLTCYLQNFCFLTAWQSKDLVDFQKLRLNWRKVRYLGQKPSCFLDQYLLWPTKSEEKYGRKKPCWDFSSYVPKGHLVFYQAIPSVCKLIRADPNGKHSGLISKTNQKSSNLLWKAHQILTSVFKFHYDPQQLTNQTYWFTIHQVLG